MNVSGMNGLFPLKNLNSGYEGYYINAAGEVFSTKRFTTPQKMAGSTQGYGSMQRQIYTFRSPSFRQARTEPGTVLLANARRHKDWAKETSIDVTTMSAFGDKPKSIFPGGAITKDRDHASDLQAGLQKKGYVIARVDGGALVFGSKPVIHTTLQSVKSEVQRLAEKSPGVPIVYLKVEGIAVANSINWQ